MTALNRDGCQDMAGTSAATRPQEYLYLGLYAFALLGLELVLAAIEPALGLPSGSLRASVVHWVLTAVIWLGGATGLVAWARYRTGFKLRGEAGTRIGVLRWLVVAGLVVLTVAAQWTLRGGVFPPVAERNAFLELFGDAGAVAWLVQVAYYVAEAVVVSLIIGFGQRAGERCSGVGRVPWGGIMLALTWGLVHFLTQDFATGIYGIALSLIMGTVHVLTGKNLFTTYPIVLVMFIL